MNGPSRSDHSDKSKREKMDGSGKSMQKNKDETTRNYELEQRTRSETHTRRSHDVRSSIISTGLVSHALREVVSDHIMAGPHGALQPVTSITTLPHLGLASPSGHQMLTLSLPDGIQFPVFFDDAISETGHGVFQYKLMALCGFIYSCCSLSTTTLSFVLPAAQYDFHLTSVDQGVLNTAPLFGMVIGAYIWGNFADSKGRKFVLFYSLLTDAIAATLSSLCQTYTLFFICRIFNGFGIIGATSIVFAYLGEFLDHSIRDHYLSRLELFWTFGIIILPVIGFAILPRDWVVTISGSFTYNSWRIFVLACGIPSFIAALLISRMPESPRFLYLQGRYDETKKVLVRMYVSNSGNRPEDFPVKVLHVDGQEDYHFAKLRGASRKAKAKIMLSGILKQHKNLFYGRSLLNIFIACFIDFGLMSVYYTFMLWIPELLQRHKLFTESHPGKPAYLCVVSQMGEINKEEKVDYDTFIHTFIVCLACLPSNIILLLVIQIVSKKSLLVCLMFAAAGPTFCLYFMHTDFELTTMLCLFEAVSTLIETVLFCEIVEIFPLSTRGCALSLTVTVGRIGAIVGNVVFGLTLERHCKELFFGMTVVLIVSGLAAFLLPNMEVDEEE